METLIQRHFPEFPGQPSYLGGSTDEDEEADEVALDSEEEEGEGEDVVLVSKREKEVIVLSSDGDPGPAVEDDLEEELRQLSSDDGTIMSDLLILAFIPA